MINKKLLIIAPYQFGELSDCYYWAKYATINGVRTTYIGYKYKNRPMPERCYEGVSVKSVFHISSRLLLGLFFYSRCILEIILNNHRNVIICRMPHCEIIANVFKNRNVILDIRTLSVSSDEFIRYHQNLELITIKKHFKTCTVISDGVGKFLGQPFHLLPLGAEEISKKQKSFDAIRLIYIGTFDGRNLSVFIRGLARFKELNDNQCTFDIIGGGCDEEVNKIKSVIKDTGIKGVVLHGFLTHDQAIHLFDLCNVGVCYIPITDYYQFQPPTKLFEYLLSGMSCIATNTFSNAEVINDKNGVLIGDDEISVLEGLSELSQKMSNYHSQRIIDTVSRYHWNLIVKNNLLPLIR